MSKARAWLCGLLFAAQESAMAAEVSAGEVPEISVTGSRVAFRTHAPASSALSVISRDEIERAGVATAAELLRQIPGATVTSSGGAGQLTQVYLRGLQSGQTLVLLDGVALNDPLNPERFFDFSTLSTAEIDRIEVARGIQSLAHGPGAVGGVIQIFTRKPKSGLRVRTGASGGAFGTRLASASVEGGTSEGLRYRLGAEHLHSEGISAAAESAGNTEPDGRQVTTVSTHLSHPWGKTSTLSLLGRFQLSRTELDDFTVTAIDDPDSISRERSLRLKLENRTALSDRLALRLSQGASLQRRNNEFLSNSMTQSGSSTGAIFYFGDRFESEASLDWQLGDQSTLALFAEYEREQGDFSEGTTAQRGLRQDTGSLGAEMRWDFERSTHTAGLRWDRNSRPGSPSALTARSQNRVKLGGSHLIEPAILGSIGTGFKSPTLYQLFYQQGGNPDLAPERSISAELGFELASKTRLWSLQFTGFESRINHQIDWQGMALGYQNIGATLSRGIEWEFRALSSFRVSGTHLFQAQNDVTGERLAQRPEFQLSAAATFEPMAGLNVDASFRFHGARRNAFPAVRMPSYSVLDLSSRWQWRKGFWLSARIENLLDRKYQEVAGYGTPGRSLFAGVEASL
ncbi:MAG: TonB-dependent receptor plug domain-containing protein [Oligoflexia bacterium]